MDPPAPRAPWSIRVWGWVLLAVSFLSLISFSIGMLSTLASSPSSSPRLAIGAVVYLTSIATGIGFVVGWRVTWFTGLVLAVAGVVYGASLLARIGGTLETRAAFGLLWVGPSLLLLVCLLLPASIRWAIGAPPASLEVPPTAPTPATPAPRRRLLLPTVTIVVAAAVVVAWLTFGRGPGSFPERAAGFRLVFSRTLDAGHPIGPPVSSPDDLRIVRQRIAAYVADGRSFEVRIIEDGVTSQFPHRVLLRAAGIGLVASGSQEVRLGRVTVESVDGVRYTCVDNTVGAGCIWTEGELTAWALGDGPRDIDRLRSLSRAVHDAVT
jgi:hypothetical protein